MTHQCRFHILDGFLGEAQKASSRKEAPSGGPSGNDQLLQHLACDLSQNHLALVLEGFQNRLDALLQDRTYTGRSLYDAVLQPLFTLSLSLKAYGHACRNGSSEAECFRNESIATLNKVIYATRTLIRGLEGEEVQEFDLMSELCSMINTYQALGELHIESCIESHTVNLLTQEEKRELLTITREALNNCIRHAKATHATVKLHRSKANICLTILDNGIGFSSTGIRSRGYGLSQMEMRARRLGGKLHVRSQKGQGTTIIAEFALEPILAPL